MRTVTEYLQANPKARPSTIAFREKCREKTEQLRREMAAEKSHRPALLFRCLRWIGART